MRHSWEGVRVGGGGATLLKAGSRVQEIIPEHPIELGNHVDDDAGPHAFKGTNIKVESEMQRVRVISRVPRNRVALVHKASPGVCTGFLPCPLNPFIQSLHNPSRKLLHV